MKIVSFRIGSEHRVGISLEAGIFDYSGAHQLYEREVTGRQWRMVRDIETLIRLARFDRESFDKIIEWVTLEGRFDEFIAYDAVLEAPLRQPGKIIALARNYAAHARETGAEPPGEPVFFAKSASTIIGPDASIEIPEGIGRVDPEVELAVVIGERVRNCPREDALKMVAGYTIINDVTARSMQKAAIERGLPWYLAKNLETFCPMGPCVILSEAVADLHDMDIELSVNGEVRQEDNTRNMLFDIPAIIEHLSRRIRLEPGDIIATGTPSGIAPIAPGDLIACRISGIGELRNPVAAAPA